MYSHGISEKIIAKALKQYNIPRSRVVILTKCYFGINEENPFTSMANIGTVNDGNMVNQVGLSRKHVFDAVQRSVERLGSYIDVLQIHRLDRGTPKEEIMRALNDVIEKGWVRYIGASSVSRINISTKFQIERHNHEGRWQLGNSKPSRTLPTNMAGTSSSQCRTTTT